MPSPTITFRLDADLKDWFDTFVTANHCDRSSVLQDLIRAMREDRLILLPPSEKTPFPANKVMPGTTREHPALITKEKR